MTTLDERLNGMKKTRIVNGVIEKLVYGLTPIRMNQQIQSHIERGWKPVGQTKMVGQYHVHKMQYEGKKVQ